MLGTPQGLRTQLLNILTSKTATSQCSLCWQNIQKCLHIYFLNESLRDGARESLNSLLAVRCWAGELSRKINYKCAKHSIARKLSLQCHLRQDNPLADKSCKTLTHEILSHPCLNMKSSFCCCLDVLKHIAAVYVWPLCCEFP